MKAGPSLVAVLAAASLAIQNPNELPTPVVEFLGADEAAAFGSTALYGKYWVAISSD